MEATEILEKLKSELAGVKAGGQQTVAIDALHKYIDALRGHVTSSVEHQKLEQQRTLAYFDAQTKHSIEMFKSVMDAGREALNALVLINGGAVVALLGFMGATLSRGLSPALGIQLAVPVSLFATGVLLGALGYGSRYLAQFFYAKAETKKQGTVCNLASIVLAVFGYLVFAVGIFEAYRTFIEQFASMHAP